MYKIKVSLYSQAVVKFTVSQARAKMAEVLSLSRSRPVLLERHGKGVAVVISPTRYEQLMEALEEVEDQVAFDQAVAELGPNVSWDEARADLGWD